LAWLVLAVAVPAAYIGFTAAGPDGNAPPATRDEQALAEHRAKMQEWLDSYGWVDRAGGIARVPIEQGMQAVLREGLPAREANEGER